MEAITLLQLVSIVVGLIVVLSVVYLYTRLGKGQALALALKGGGVLSICIVVLFQLLRTISAG